MNSPNVWGFFFSTFLLVVYTVFTTSYIIVWKAFGFWIVVKIKESSELVLISPIFVAYWIINGLNLMTEWLQFSSFLCMHRHGDACPFFHSVLPPWRFKLVFLRLFPIPSWFTWSYSQYRCQIVTVILKNFQERIKSLPFGLKFWSVNGKSRQKKSLFLS